MPAGAKKKRGVPAGFYQLKHLSALYIENIIHGKLDLLVVY
jgi:hypothetical protein